MAGYITITDHALEAMQERGASEAEVRVAAQNGEMIPAKKGRFIYVKNFSFDAIWRGKYYKVKQVHAVVSHHGEERRVVTVIVKYFGEE
ncbi:MAG: DUF4258 domain-containing protein [Betaproteobacteria bacterium]